MKSLLILLLTTSACSAYPRHRHKTTDHFYLKSKVNEDSAKELVEELEQSTADRIVIEIKTPGGDVDEGFKISKAIEKSKIPITCVVDDMAASMGFYILQSCPIRVMTKRSTLMAHEPSESALIPSFQPTQWQNIATEVKALADAMAEWSGHRLVGGAAEYKRQTANGREWWLDWHEALKVGAVDRVVDLPSELCLR